MVRQYARPELKFAARKLRRDMTDAERHLWAWLRRKRVAGVQFYRQRPIASYIVDFYAPAARLVVEVDGAQHFDEPNRTHDENRTAALALLGIRVLRFDNRQVLTETKFVLDEIFRAVAERIPPSPPLKKGGSHRTPFSKGGRSQSERGD